MKIETFIKYLRISPKKLKVLAQKVIGLSPEKALEKLVFSNNKESKVLNLSIKSALSNALNNFKLNSSKLKITSIATLKGPVFKRWQPVSRGMAHQIKKRTSHLKVVLEEIQGIQVKPSEKTTERNERGTKS